jgi:hypothetical protein
MSCNCARWARTARRFWRGRCRQPLVHHPSCQQLASFWKTPCPSLPEKPSLSKFPSRPPLIHPSCVVPPKIPVERVLRWAIHFWLSFCVLVAAALCRQSNESALTMTTTTNSACSKGMHFAGRAACVGICLFDDQTPPS